MIGVIARRVPAVALCLLTFAAASPIPSPAGLWTLSGTDGLGPGQSTNVTFLGSGISLPTAATSMSSWIAGTSLPAGLASQAAVAVTRWGYGDASTSATSWVFIAGGRDAGGPTAQVTRLSLSGNSLGSPEVLSSTPLPSPTQEHGLVALDAGLILLGGKVGSAPSNQVLLAPFTWDSRLKPWRSAPAQLPAARWQHGSVAYRGFVYVIGGSPTADGASASTDVFVANPTADGRILSWSNTTPLPEARTDMAVAASGGFLYVIGGSVGAGTVTATVLRAAVAPDGTLGPWVSMPSLPTPRRSLAAAVQMNEIMAVGGRDAAGAIRRDVARTRFTDSDGALAPWSAGTPYDFYIADQVVLPGASAFLVLGGQDIFGNLKPDSRRTDLGAGSSYALTGSYVSPVLNLGGVHGITQLSWTANLSGQSVSVRQRTAGADGLWSAWSPPASASPMTVGTTARFVQFEVGLTGDGTAAPSCTSFSWDVPGLTFVSGNLSGATHWTAAQSPCVVTGTIYAQSGTLTVDAGVEVRFRSGTGMKVRASNVRVNGTPGGEVLWSSLSDSTADWGTIVYESTSSAGVASDWSDAIIENGGQPFWYPYLMACESTTEPTLTECTLRSSDAGGLYSMSSRPSLILTQIDAALQPALMANSSGLVAPNLAYCTITGRGAPSVHVFGGSPVLLGTVVTNADTTGLYVASGSPQLRSCSFTSASNYAVRMMPGSSPTFAGCTYGSPRLPAVAIEAGSTGAARWSPTGVGYAVLGTVDVSSSTLSIAPGDTLRFAHGAQLRANYYNNSNGAISAIGTPDSAIVFTSLDGTNSGWDGIYLINSASMFDRCVIEKVGGSQGALYSNGSRTVTLRNSSLNSVATRCLYLYSPATVDSCTFAASPSTTVECYGTGISMQHSSISSLTGVALFASAGDFTQVTASSRDTCAAYVNGPVRLVASSFTSASYYAVRMAPYSSPTFAGCTYGSPRLPAVAIESGSTGAARWSPTGVGYAVLGTVDVSSWTLSIAPGDTLRFARGAQLRANYYNNSNGAISAIGTPDSAIVFTSLDGTNSGWDGIYLINSASTFDRCVIEKVGGSQGALYSNGSSTVTLRNSSLNSVATRCLYLYSPATVDSCTFAGSPVTTVECYSAGISMQRSSITSLTGMPLFASAGTFTQVTASSRDTCAAYVQGSIRLMSCSFTSASNYALRMAPYSSPTFAGCTYGSPRLPAVAIESGSTGAARWSPTGVGYAVLGTVDVSSSTLSIAPGDTLRFARGAQLRANYYGSNAAVSAIGTPDSAIVFTSLDGSSGGWDGIYLINSASTFDRCVIEKAGAQGYAVRCQGSAPTLSRCTVRLSSQAGISCAGTAAVISHCDISENAGAGVTISSSPLPVLGGNFGACNRLCANGLYELEMRGAGTLDARFNWWCAADSTSIAARVFDGRDQSGYGIVTFVPFSGSSCLEANPPEPFSLVGPANGSIAPTLQPTFSWRTAHDADVGSVVRYRVLISQDSTFATSTRYDAIPDTSFAVQGPLMDDRRYWWRVIAYDTSLMETRSIQSWTFVANVPPTQPTAITPVAGEATHPTSWLVWLASHDPGGASVSYVVQIDDDTTFASPAIQETLTTVRLEALRERGYSEIRRQSGTGNTSPSGDDAFAVQLQALSGSPLQAERMYRWRVQALDNHMAASPWSDGLARFRYTVPTDAVDGDRSVPSALGLDPVWPNPSRNGAQFRLGLPRAGDASLLIYSIDGRLVRQLHLGSLPTGYHVRVWNGLTESGLVAPPGVYWALLLFDGQSRGRKLVVIR